jgi:GrpB-like predicted nucleotidyltransferase (UPF0157 family)
MIQVVAYDTHWPHSFQELRIALADALGRSIISIHHVGSTAVPGLAAKPIIDLDIVVATAERVSRAIAILATLGYIHQGNLGIPEREAFKRSGEDVPRDGSGRIWPSHHLYLCPQESAELARHLALRDYLRQSPEAAAAYGRLKRELATRHPDDRDAYTRGKSEFIADIYSRVL